MEDVSRHDGFAATALHVNRDVARRVANRGFHPDTVAEFARHKVVHVHQLGQARIDNRQAAVFKGVGMLRPA